MKGAVGLDADVRLLDRHVLTETAVAGGAATGAFVFVMVAGNILNQVSSAIASGRVSGWEGLELIALLIPGVLPYALPLGLLTGVLLAFGRMGSQQELTAMKAGGLSLGRIARPALLLAQGDRLLHAWLNFWGMVARGGVTVTSVPRMHAHVRPAYMPPIVRDWVNCTAICRRGPPALCS